MSAPKKLSSAGNAAAYPTLKDLRLDRRFLLAGAGAAALALGFSCGSGGAGPDYDPDASFVTDAGGTAPGQDGGVEGADR